MENLRHVLIDAVEDNKQWTFVEPFNHWTFNCSSDELSSVLLQSCPNLEELKIYFSVSVKSEEEICTFGLKLECLSQLQSLCLYFRSEKIRVSELLLPSNLKELVIYGSHTLPLLGGLPNLEYLHAITDRGPSSSEEWCLRDITFDKLKVLKLESDISRRDVSEVSFPMLETLVLTKCQKLEEISPSFADIPTLKQIELRYCFNKSLEDSAAKIKEEVYAIEGCDCIVLFIYN